MACTEVRISSSRSSSMRARCRWFLPSERVAPRQAACWVRDLAEALAHAHRQGILHRDVKPANILITARSEPLLADFGLALDVDELTQADAVCGTPAYMAPEQVHGDPTAGRPAQRPI